MGKVIGIMRVTAESVLREAQTVSDRNPVDLSTDYSQDSVESSPSRSSKLAQIELESLVFAEEFLLDFELPANPSLKIDNLRGFENTKKSFKEVVGVANVTGSFYTMSGQKVRFTLEIPVRDGEFVKPSIVRYNNKRHVISQDFFDTVVRKTRIVSPRVSGPFSPSMNFIHEEKAQRFLFSSPEDPSGWGLLLTERY